MLGTRVVYLDCGPPCRTRCSYPYAGKNNVTVALGVVGVPTGTTSWADLGAEADIYLARVRWLPCSRGLSYQWLSRDQQAVPAQMWAESRRRCGPSPGADVDIHVPAATASERVTLEWAAERIHSRSLIANRFAAVSVLRCFGFVHCRRSSCGWSLWGRMGW